MTSSEFEKETSDNAAAKTPTKENFDTGLERGSGPSLTLRNPDDSDAGTIHEYFVLIRESHLDTFGHVNNATYLQLFEEARWDLITERGYGKDVIFAKRLGPVILDVTVKFRREVKNREQVVIRTELVEHSAKIGKLRQRLYRAVDEQLACDALFSIALWDIDARKLVAPTPEWAHAILLSGAGPT